ncbi:hypothetical protein [Burkholderia contaminans]|nr:hypothetical protein [Burkholderia contaminans]WFN15522.1 hypothetical protein LXE92_32235 [Burkholderia contaminans]
MVFDNIELQGMNAAQRAKVIAHLASLLIQAAGITNGKGRTMTNADCLPASLLQRKAVVSVRQSTQVRLAWLSR